MNIELDEKQKGTSMSKALSFALCFINRLEAEKPVGTTLYPRILVIQASPDISAQYISVMNSIFSAQKMNVTVDACILGNEDSTFLQQAAHITGGVYMKPMRQEGLVQYLLGVYLVEKELRKVIQLPMQNLVDLRASCFETKKPIDNGYVCSVCLSVFSKYSPVCSTCGTKFKIKVPKR
jgi:transcription initiation factor TFIIH subunit 3